MKIRQDWIRLSAFIRIWQAILKQRYFRDVAVYQISCFKNGVPMATEILSEVSTHTILSAHIQSIFKQDYMRHSGLRINFKTLWLSGAVFGQI